MGHISECRSHEAEALACFMGLKFDVDYCFLEVILENDNFEVIDAISKSRNMDNQFGLIISNYLSLLHLFRSIQFSHVKRNRNRVALKLAQLAFTNPNSVWMEGAPDHICNLVVFDHLCPNQ